MKHYILCVLLFVSFQSKPTIAQTELPGFPITYPKASGGNSITRERGPLVYDIDQDGVKEIIELSYTGQQTGRSNRVLIYDPQSPAQPEYVLDMPTNLDNEGFTFSQSAAVADGDGDGVPELIIPAWLMRVRNQGNCPSQSYCWHQGALNICHHHVSEILTWEFGIAGPVLFESPSQDYKLTCAGVADVSGDGFDDLVFAGTIFDGLIDEDQIPGSGWGNAVIAYFWNSPASRWDVLQDVTEFHCNPDILRYPLPVWETMTALGDFRNSDEVAEIAAILPDALSDEGYAKFFLVQFYPTFSILEEDVLTGKYPLDSDNALNEDSEGFPGPVAADFDQNGTLDAAFVVQTSELGTSSKQVAIYDGTQQGFTYVTIPGNYLFKSRDLLAVAHRTEQEFVGIFLASRNEIDTQMQWLHRSTLGNWSFIQNPNSWPKTFSSAHASLASGYAPAILNTDQLADFEFVTQIGAGGNNSIWNLKLNVTGGNDFSWAIGNNFVSEYKYLSAPSAHDLNLDGEVELVVTAEFASDQGRIHAYELDIPYQAVNDEWSQFQNGPKHTGLYAQPVSGEQQREYMVWEGRIIVHDKYIVPTGYTLMIEPGTVVEFRPDAYVIVEGTLLAEGLGTDSIYFKADGSSPWNGLYLVGAEATLSKCAFHGGGIVYAEGGQVSIEDCRLYNMDIGLDVYDCENAGLTFSSNVIEDCDYYGIRGTLSAGTFTSNTIQNCGRAGIYWVGNKNSTQQAPYFGWNHIANNGSTTIGIAGGYFNSTEAGLSCNTFADNYPNQVACENSAHLGMCEITGQHGNNELRADASVIWCGTCDGRCTCTPPPTNYAPLMRISKSKPYMYKGHNKFIYEDDGVFVSNLACPNAAHQVDLNYFSAFGRAYSAPIDPSDPRFCRSGVFTAADLDEEPSSCLSVSPLAGPTAAALALKNAVLTEQSSSYLNASQEYKSIAETYPGSEESVIAAKGYLRSSIAAGAPYGQSSDTLASTSEEIAEEETRNALFTESVWALASGGMFENARPILDSVLSVAVESNDSTWALFMLDVITLLEDTTSHGFSTGNRQPKRAKVNAFHDRIHELMGRDEDREAHNLDSDLLPQGFALHQNYPNPFNPSTEFSFDLPEGSIVELKVFDILGREVATIADKYFEAGMHHINWDSRSTGSTLASGVYIYQIKAGGFADAKKMILLR